MREDNDDMANARANSVGTLMAVVGQMLDPSTQRKIHGHVSVSWEGDRTEYEVWADPETGCWESIDHEVGVRDVYNPEDGLLLTSPGSRDVESVERGRVENMPQHLGFFFPLRLSIWSRSRDEWQMTGAATDSDQQVTVGLQSRTDNSVGSLIVNAEGLPIRLTEPGQEMTLIRYETFAGHPEFWWR